MDRLTRAKVDSLLYEIRSWKRPNECGVEDLARKFQLDPLIVQRILESEGLEVDETLELDPEESSGRVTAVLDLEEIERARRRAAEGGED